VEPLSELFRTGGPVMAPIAAASVAAWLLGLRNVLCARHGDRGRLEGAQTLLGCLVAVLPLLGLLGTVTGMIDTFDVIRVHGNGEPRLLARGIREALITTEAGLVTALPALVLHTIAAGRIRRAKEAGR